MGSPSEGSIRLRDSTAVCRLGIRYSDLGTSPTASTRRAGQLPAIGIIDTTESRGKQMDTDEDAKLEASTDSLPVPGYWFCVMASSSKPTGSRKVSFSETSALHVELRHYHRFQATQGYGFSTPARTSKPLLPTLVRSPQPFHQHLLQRPTPQLGGKPHSRTQRPPQPAAVERPHRPLRHRLKPHRNQPHHLIQIGRLHLVVRNRRNRRAQLRRAQWNHRQPHPLRRRARLRGILHRLAVRPFWRRPPVLLHHPRAHLRIHAGQRLFHHHVLCRKHKVVQQKLLAVPPSQLVVMRAEPALEEPTKRRQRRALQRLRNRLVMDRLMFQLLHQLVVRGRPPRSEEHTAELQS